MRVITKAMLVIVLAGCLGCRKTEPPLVDPAAQAQIADAMQALLAPNARMTLYSLHPYLRDDSASPDTDRLHGYRILGRAEITDRAEQRSLLNALADGVRKNRGVVAMCFNPRHALRIEGGFAPIDLVICFECLQIYPHGFNGDKGIVTSEAPEPVFDAALKNHGLPKDKA